MIMFFLCFLVFLIFYPNDAFAWGPVTHLEYASNAIASLPLFPPLVKRLIGKYQEHFLYGSVAADITLGKDYRGYLYNCHNWNVAFDIYHQKAKKDFQKAFMLGYLGHLAADTVAHNFFVPFKMIRSWNTKLLKHVYWEIRMDLSVPEKHWNHLHELTGHDEFLEDDKLLEDHLQKTFFSFRTNKKIFNRLLGIQRAKQYRSFAHRVVKKSSWILEEADIKRYKGLAQKSVIDFLKNMEDSFCMHADPTGKLKILFARDLVGSLRSYRKKNLLSQEGEVKIISDVKVQLEKGIYRVVQLPAIEAYLG